MASILPWALRGLLALPLVLWGLQLAGRLYLPAVGVAEHAVLEQVLVAGWMLDEAVGASPGLAVGIGGAGALLLGGLLGAVKPGAPWVCWTQPVAAVALAVPLGALAVLAFGMAPATFVVLMLLCALAPIGPAHERTVAWTLRALVPGAGLALLFAADLLATSREGTWYDRLTDLAGGTVPPWLGWTLLALAVVGAAVPLRARGLPALPDPGTPATWAPGLVLPSLVALAVLLGNGLLEVQYCPDADHPAVRLVHDAPTPFDLAWDGAALGVVHREAGWLRILDPDGTVQHEITPVEGDLEEVFALPGGGFLLTEILDDDPFTLLREVDPTTGTTVDHRLPGMCWISSMVWDPVRDAALLGCETQADVLRFYRDGRLERVGRLPAEDDLEDLHLRTDERRAYAVSLAEGDRLWALSPDDGSEIASARIGGLNYSVVHDPGSDRILVARFHDAQVVAFDPALRPVGRVHAGFGVRPLVGLPAHGMVLSAGMFDGRLRAIDAEQMRVVDSLRLGGRVKALDADPEESRAWLGSTCGVFEVDLRRWLDGAP